MASKLTPDQVREYLSDFSNNQVYSFSNPNYNVALEATLDLIDDYRVLLSDLMHYGLIRCKSCGHYSMKDEDICHICYRPLVTEKADVKSGNKSSEIASK